MKKAIAISLLVIINAGFIWLNGWTAGIRYGIIVGSLGQERSIEVDRELSEEIIIQAIYFIALIAVLNYVIVKKMLLIKKPIIYSSLISITAVSIFIPFFINARHDFLEHNKNITLGWIAENMKTIEGTWIIQHDTNDFMTLRFTHDSLKYHMEPVNHTYDYAYRWLDENSFEYYHEPIINGSRHVLYPRVFVRILKLDDDSLIISLPSQQKKYSFKRLE